VAKALGAGSRGQAMAALFCATLRLEYWRVPERRTIIPGDLAGGAVWFALRVAREGRMSDALWWAGRWVSHC